MTQVEWIAWIALVAILLALPAAYGLVLRRSLARERGALARRLLPRSLHLRTQIGLGLLAVVPALGIALTLGLRHVDDHLRDANVGLQDAAAAVAAQADAHVELHLAGIRGLAASIAGARQFDQASAAAWLRRFHAIYPALLTSLAVDASGRVVAATRRSGARIADAPPSPRPVDDREYFQVPMSRGGDYVSPAFRGRGLGDDPIVAISAAIDRGDGPVGVVQGALDLQAFAALEAALARVGDGARLVLLDERRRVLYASPGLGFAALDELAGHPLAGRAGGPPFTVELAGAAGQAQRWRAAARASPRGWLAIAALPEQRLLAAVGSEGLAAMAWLVAVLASGALLALGLHRSVVEPVGRLRRMVAEFSPEASPGPPALAGLPAEFVGLFRAMHRQGWRLRASYRRLSRALQDSRTLQSELFRSVAKREEEVQLRTRQLDAANQELQRVARTDALTALGNRRAFDEFLPRAGRVAQRTGDPVAVLLLDVDSFKAYNDHYGHPAGDDCLQAIARVVAAVAGRGGDLAARYGGEEFAVVLSGTEAGVAVQMAEGLRRAIERLARPHARSAAGVVTASIGVAVARPSGETTIDTVVAAADRALYAAKQAGRNRVAQAEGDAVHHSRPGDDTDAWANRFLQAAAAR